MELFTYPRPPKFLYDMLTGESGRQMKFQKNTAKYNTLFSFGLRKINSLTVPGRGIPIAKVFISFFSYVFCSNKVLRFTQCRAFFLQVRELFVRAISSFTTLKKLLNFASTVTNETPILIPRYSSSFDDFIQPYFRLFAS